MPIPMEEKLKWQKWLREHPTKAEDRLRSVMSEHPSLAGKFEFQAIVCGFIVDFWFPAAKLAIEVDGSIHQEPEQIEKDRNKTAALKNKDIFVLRIKNQYLFENIKKAVYKICSRYSSRKRKEFYATLPLKRRKTRKKSFAMIHCCKFQKYGDSHGIRRKRNSAGASTPKSELLMMTQRPSGIRKF